MSRGSKNQAHFLFSVNLPFKLIDPDIATNTVMFNL